MTLRKSFQVIEYDLEYLAIKVLIKKGNQESEVSINRQKYEDWLENTDRLEWEDDVSDAYGEHYQRSGRLSINEYWDSSAEQIRFDLYEYIIIQLTIRTMANPFASVIHKNTAKMKDYDLQKMW